MCVYVYEGRGGGELVRDEKLAKFHDDRSES